MNIEELYKKIENTVYSICYSYLELAEKYMMTFDDLVGLCNVCFMENYFKYNPNKGASFNTYMTKVIKTNLIKHFRYLGAKKRCFKGEIIRIDGTIDVNENKSGNISDILADKNELLLDIEYEEMLQDILNIASLTKDGREIVLLKLEGYTVTEIGGILNTSRQNISNRLTRIRQLLKQNRIIDKHISL